MRILWVSVAPFCPSGYGTQSGIWTQQLKKLGHDVAIFGYRGILGTTTMWNDIPVFPQSRLTHFGLDTIPYWYEQHQADLAICLSDLFIYADLRAQMAASKIKFVPWMPIDCEPLGAADHNILSVLTSPTAQDYIPDGSGFRQVSRTWPMAMSRHGQKMLTDAGFADPLYLPHGIDTDLFHPFTDGQRAELRASLGLSASTFIAGTNSANESSEDRKAFAEQLQAFAGFAERHPDSLLLVHALKNRHPVGLDLASICTRLGIEDKVLFADESLYDSGSYTPEMLRDQLYGILDVYLGASKAEGFGIPLIEAQACGVPVITTDGSAMSEHTAGGLAGAYRVPGEKVWSTLHSSWWTRPGVGHLEDALEQFFAERRKGTISECREAAREFALDYSIPRVTEEHLRPVLAKLEEWIPSHDYRYPPEGQPSARASASDRPDPGAEAGQPEGLDAQV